jgi:integrase
VTAPVARLPAARLQAAAAAAAPGQALAAITGYLDRCKLAARTVTAYRRQCRAYITWLGKHAGKHPDAFADAVGAEAAVTAWRRSLLTARRKPSTVNQALAAVTLMYGHAAGIEIEVKRARVPRPGAPAALTAGEQGAVQRAADRRGPRDAAIIAVLLYTGARAGECARVADEDLAVTPRTGQVRLLGKGDEVRTVPIPKRGRDRISAYRQVRGGGPGPFWVGQRGPLTVSGITQVVLAVGTGAGIEGLRPHRLRDTYATRMRQGGADPAQIQAQLGHARLETTARYFRAGLPELAAVVERVFEE